MSNEIEVVAAVIRDGERVLACRRGAARSAGGKWEFPGGKVEAGESPEQALTREIREELGVGITVGALVDRSTTQVGEQAVDLACYDAVLDGPLPTQSTDHDELRWLLPHELGSLDWAEPDLPAVQLLESRATIPRWRAPIC